MLILSGGLLQEIYYICILNMVVKEGLKVIGQGIDNICNVAIFGQHMQCYNFWPASPKKRRNLKR